eukprot:scaffold92533_cov69-Phaeocystis_antarctica.AAC.1
MILLTRLLLCFRLRPRRAPAHRFAAPRRALLRRALLLFRRGRAERASTQQSRHRSRVATAHGALERRLPAAVGACTPHTVGEQGWQHGDVAGRGGEVQRRVGVCVAREGLLRTRHHHARRLGVVGEGGDVRGRHAVLVACEAICLGVKQQPHRARHALQARQVKRAVAPAVAGRNRGAAAQQQLD